MSARRRSKKKSYNLERLGDFLPQALKKGKIFVDTLPSDLPDLWEKAVGPQIARQTEPVRFRNGLLSVNVTTSAWMQQLQFMKEDILEKVNATDSQRGVNRIRFSIGPVVARPSSAEGKVNEASLDESRLRNRDRRLIAERLAAIEDDDLREIMRRVMIRDALNRSSTS